jgi:DNA helicase II / ATP-dependent DNA helicase PcrA
LQRAGEPLQSRSRFILVDEFQDVNFAQVKVLQKLAGEERNVFAVGDPDQAIYRFRGASSAAFVLFQRHFPSLRLVKLEKNRRSTSPILNCAFALISKNPDVFDASAGSTAYQRSVLISAREQDAAREGKQLPRAPVEAVVLAAKDFECTELVAALRDWQRKTRHKWSDCAVLYRTHSHRDQLAAELATQGIPFSIENMDVMDMPEARDLRLPGRRGLGCRWRQPVPGRCPSPIRNRSRTIAVRNQSAAARCRDLGNCIGTLAN